jgi:hypothetical protein
MFTLFLFGTFWFWALIALAYVTITILTEIDAPGWATITAVVTALLLQWFGQINIFQWIKLHPTELLIYLFAYLLIGLIYSVLKWTSFIHKKAKSDKEGYDRHHYDMKEFLAPRVEDFSSRIIGWMAYWPCNIVWTLLNDPIRAFFEWLFTVTKSLFQRIADHAYANIAK